jgi:hypothetical protein
MSHQLIVAAAQLRGPMTPAMRSVLIVVADWQRAPEHSPEIVFHVLARQALMGESALRVAVARLEKAGLLEVTRRCDPLRAKLRLASLYRVTVLDRTSPRTEPSWSASEPSTLVTDTQDDSVASAQDRNPIAEPDGSGAADVARTLSQITSDFVAGAPDKFTGYYSALAAARQLGGDPLCPADTPFLLQTVIKHAAATTFAAAISGKDLSLLYRTANDLNENGAEWVIGGLLAGADRKDTLTGPPVRYVMAIARNNAGQTKR